jgi:post-segregation antitoxin (ccd killing protein)
MPRLTSRTLPPASPRRADSSQAREHGLTAEDMETRRLSWFEENREAVEAWNEYVALQGLPLAAFRQF